MLTSKCYYIFLPYLLVLFSHKVQPNHGAARLDSIIDNIEPVIYTLSTVDADSKVMPRYISDVQ